MGIAGRQLSGVTPKSNNRQSPRPQAAVTFVRRIRYPRMQTPRIHTGTIEATMRGRLTNAWNTDSDVGSGSPSASVWV